MARNSMALEIVWLIAWNLRLGYGFVRRGVEEPCQGIQDIGSDFPKHKHNMRVQGE